MGKYISYLQVVPPTQFNVTTIYEYHVGNHPSFVMSVDVPRSRKKKDARRFVQILSIVRRKPRSTIDYIYVITFKIIGNQIGAGHTFTENAPQCNVKDITYVDKEGLKELFSFNN